MNFTIEEKHERHRTELRRLMKLAIERNMTPANQHIHKIPESERDDSQFFYGVPPFRPDGSVNPEGVPPPRERDFELPEGCELLKEVEYFEEWQCKKCKIIVKTGGQSYDGQNEPEWWYWCVDCRKKFRVGPGFAKKKESERDIKKRKETENVKVLTKYFKKK